MKEIRIAKTKKQISDALNTRNKSITNYFHDLSLNSKVLIWRERSSGRSSKWIESFNLLSMENEICKIEMPYDFMEFTRTIVKPYYRASIGDNENTGIVSDNKQVLSDEEESSNDKKKTTDQPLEFQNMGVSAITPSAAIPGAITPGAVTSGAAAPNAAALGVPDRAESEETPQPPSIKRGRGRPRKQSNAQLNQSNLAVFLLNKIDSSTSSPRIPYAESRRKEINDLLNKRIFDVIALTDVLSGVKLFNFRFVDEIKNPSTSTAFEKSRLVV